MRKIWLAAALLLTEPASAEFVDIPKSSTFSTLSTQVQQVIDATGLSEKDGISARVTAATWVYLGPCKRSTNDLPKVDDRVFQIVVDARPQTKWGAAVLQMIAIMMRDDLGRETEAKCDFAKAMASSGQ